MRRFLAFAVIALVASAAPVGADTGIRMDPAHTGGAPAALSPRPVKLWERYWEGATRVSAAVVVGDRAFAAIGYSTDPRDDWLQAVKVVAVHSRTGATLWEKWLDPDAVVADLAYADGRLFAYNTAGWLYALDPATGKTLWLKSIYDGGHSPPTVSGGRVFVHGKVFIEGEDGNDHGPGVAAFDAATGNLLWQTRTPSTSGDFSPPAVADGRVFVVGPCANTYALSATTGAVLWLHEGDCWGGGGATAAVHDGRVYLGDPSRRFVLDAATGEHLGQSPSLWPAFLGDTGFFTTDAQQVEARDLPSGKTLWTRPYDMVDFLAEPAIVSSRTVYYRAGGTDIVALDTATGKDVGRVRVGEHLGLMHTDGRTLVANLDNDGLAGVDVSGAAVGSGYWMLRADGVVYPFGDVGDHGEVSGIDAVNLAATPSGRGYWVVSRSGGVYAFGDAPHLGGFPALAPGEAVTTIAGVPTGGGYWLFTNRGRAIPYGSAQHFGDMAGTPLNGGVVASAATPTGRGYLMVAADGGVFAFGDAGFLGSMGGTPLNQPVVGAATDPDGRGYWLIAADGGMFAFDAPFKGSMGGTPLNKPVVGGVPFGDGYLMAASDGGVFNFSSRRFAGSLGANPPPVPITAITAFAH